MISTWFLSVYVDPAQFPNLDLNRMIHKEGQCHQTPNSLKLIKKDSQFFHNKFSIFHKCILGTEHLSNVNPITFIPDSMCPLGIQVINELKQRNANFIDVRGKAHLDINSQSGNKILRQYNIEKVLMVCDTNQTRRFYANNSRNFNFISAIPELPGKVNFILKHPVFGHMRGKHTNASPYDMYFDCINHSLSKSVRPGEWILATDVAPIIASHLKTQTDIEIKVPVYTSTYLHSKFYLHCIKGESNQFVEKQLESCHPYPPIGRNLTLSIVCELTDNQTYCDRFNAISKYYDHYLTFYPHLPFEFVLLFVHTKPEQTNPFDVLKLGPNFKKYVRIIEISFEKYKEILNKFHPTNFPKYIIKNIGIRRAKGEFIIAVSPDSFPNKKLFEMVLHHQFTPHTLERGIRTDADLEDFDSSIAMMDLEEYDREQYFVNHRDPGHMFDMVLSDGASDFQGGHWKAWRNIKGYVEGDFTNNVDTLLSLEFISQQPNLLLVNPIGKTYHYRHQDVPGEKKDIPFTYEGIKNNLDMGILTCDLDNLKRDNWGFPNDQELPSIVF